MTTLNSRGHEVVSSIPFEAATMLGRAPRLSLAEQIRLMIRREQVAETDQIRDDADLYEDQADFADESGADGLLGPSRYEVPDEVPDGVSAAEIRAAQKRAAEEAAKNPPAEPATSADVA